MSVEEADRSGLSRVLGRFPASRNDLFFEGLGADVAQMGVAAGSSVDNLDVVEHIGTRKITGFVDSFADTLALPIIAAVL